MQLSHGLETTDLRYRLEAKFRNAANVIQRKYYFNIITNSVLNLVSKSLEFQTFNYTYT